MVHRIQPRTQIHLSFTNIPFLLQSKVSPKNTKEKQQQEGQHTKNHNKNGSRLTRGNRSRQIKAEQTLSSSRVLQVGEGSSIDRSNTLAISGIVGDVGIQVGQSVGAESTRCGTVERLVTSIPDGFKS